MDNPHILLTSGWVIYCLLHSLLASRRIKDIAQNLMGAQFKYYRLMYSLFALFGLIWLAYFQVQMVSPALFRPYQVFSYIAVAVGLFGIFGLVLSLKKYISSPKGFNDLFFEGVKPNLQTQGLHSKVRHPIYLFTFLLIWAGFLIKPLLSVLLVNTVITLYTLIAIRFEEQKLIELYGKEYEDYRKRVPMILPFRMEL